VTRVALVRSTRIAFVAVAVACAVAALRWWLVGSPGFAVRRVEWHGLRRASCADLETALDLRGRNLFRAELGAARERLLAQPWIADASIVRVPPHAVRVSVVEREPVAQESGADGDWLLDASGSRIVTTDAVEEAAWPSLAGCPSSGAEAGACRAHAARTLVALRAVAPALVNGRLRVEVEGVERLALRHPDQPLIEISGPESADEVAGWLAHAAGLKERVGGIATVDARWSQRLFLGRRTTATDPGGSKALRDGAPAMNQGKRKAV
jgi:cell division protein FtsQ